MTPRPTISMIATKAMTLPSVKPSEITMDSRSAEALDVAFAKAGQQHQRQHHGQVFHDQPADGDVAAFGFDEAALLQGPQQNHRTGHREGKAEDDAAADTPPHQPGETHAEKRSAGDLNDGAWNRDGPDRDEVLEREMKADAEHQQNHADLGELIGEPLIRHVAGKGTDRRERRREGSR